MIIDKLKEIEKNNQWDHEHLDTIDGHELLQEVSNEYVSFAPIDYVFYSTIPSNILDIIMEQNEKGEYNIFGTNPFYERLLLQVLYMQSRGLDVLYGKAIMALLAPGEASFYLHNLLSKEEEYNFIWEEYNRYLNKSYNSIMNQSNILNNLAKIDKNELEKAVNSLKDFIPKEVE